jgi:catechol 2,3-dioxygenase-like lactoylglutathione lyase family enzyme
MGAQSGSVASVKPTTPLFDPVVQVAYYVPDPAAAATAWASERGAGPFFLRPHIEVHDVTYRGTASHFDHTSAYGWWGDVMVELFTQHDDAPSAARERFAAHESGLHHLACFVDDIHAALDRCTAAGLVVAQTAYAGQTLFAFVDDVTRHGHYWELYEGNDRLRGFYSFVRSASEGWDGSDPVREV